MNPLKWLTKRVQEMGTPHEDETKRDGFLSYSAEVHAVGLGFYDGMKTVRARPQGIPDNADAQAEPHYYKGSYVAGTVTQAVILVGLGVGSGVLPF